MCIFTQLTDVHVFLFHLQSLSSASAQIQSLGTVWIQLPEVLNQSWTGFCSFVSHHFNHFSSPVSPGSGSSWIHFFLIYYSPLQKPIQQLVQNRFRHWIYELGPNWCQPALWGATLRPRWILFTYSRIFQINCMLPDLRLSLVLDLYSHFFCVCGQADLKRWVVIWSILHFKRCVLRLDFDGLRTVDSVTFICDENACGRNLDVLSVSLLLSFVHLVQMDVARQEKQFELLPLCFWVWGSEEQQNLAANWCRPQPLNDIPD